MRLVLKNWSSAWAAAVLLLAGATAASQAQTDTPSQGGQPNQQDKPSSGASDGASATSADHDVIISTPQTDSTLPPLPPDQFVDCTKRNPGGAFNFDLTQSAICQHELNGQKRIVVKACLNRDNKESQTRAIQACSELLDQNIFEGRDRFFVFASRAKAYLTQGDKTHGLEDLNQAIKLAPRDAGLYFDRGLYYAAQPDLDAALQDFNKALGFDAKLVPALEQRAKIHQVRKEISEALQDYSEAIRLEPKSAALWSERGYAHMQNKDFKSAVSDETEAIRLQPNFARALYLRGAAYGNLGDSHNATDDIKAAVNLDDSMAQYVVIQGKNVSLKLPPL